MSKVLVVGAGLSGAVLGRALAESGRYAVTIIDQRSHLGGNCHTQRDVVTGAMLHVYGPHIFNTDSEIAWNYVRKFADMVPYVNRVKAITPKGVFAMPINLHTINQFFGMSLSPTEAKVFVEKLGDRSIKAPGNFEEQALSMLGCELYENFFYGYTKKQWGCEPRTLPAYILKRLPVRFTYDDSYYATKYQAIPREGYTDLIERVLDHSDIRVQMGVVFEQDMRRHYHHTFYTGPLDLYYRHKYGRLSYRTLTFERVDGHGDILGNAVINYTSEQVAFTRAHEPRLFTPWERPRSSKSVAFREYSSAARPNDCPYYPIRLQKDIAILKQYVQAATDDRKSSFLGRLGTYRYLDMDDVILEALEFAAALLGDPDWRPVRYRFSSNPLEA